MFVQALVIIASRLAGRGPPGEPNSGPAVTVARFPTRPNADFQQRIIGFVSDGFNDLRIGRTRTSLPRQYSLDLLQVVDVVSGKHAHDMLNRFLAALGVYSVVFPLLRRQRLKQRQVGFPKRAELL